MRWRSLVVLLLTLTAFGCKPEPAAPVPPSTAPATQPAETQPTSRPATEPAPATYLDVIRSRYPTLPATQPLTISLTLRESAHVVLPDPVVLDEQGHLWITRSDGIEAATITRRYGPSTDTEHVVRESVLFVWWIPDRTQTFAPHVIARRSDGQAELIVASNRWPIGSRSDYRWDRARSWADGQVHRLIVPTRTGLSVFTFESDREPISEAFQDLGDLRVAAPQTTTPAATVPAMGVSRVASSEGLPLPRYLFDPRGLLAWIPATPAAAGSNGAARYVGGKWTVLTPDAGWTDRMLHLIPLRDGSVTQLLQAPAEQGGGVKIALASVETPAVNRQEIINLVDSLSDADNDIRNAAYTRLTEYGPGIWPILREIPTDDVAPEVRSRLNRLLKSQATPMLGGMGLQGDQLKLVSRLRDGGVVFYTDQGVNVHNPAGDEPIGHAPAWVAARPGRAVEMLTGPLVFHADPKRTRFDVVQGQWIVTNEDTGPQLFLGNGFRTLLRKDSREFSELIGVDRRGRWVFRKPQSEETAERSGETLIIDPTLPDFTPRLPVWLYTDADEVGWDRQGWPAVRLDQLRSRLTADQWVNLTEADEFLVDPPAPETVELQPVPASPGGEKASPASAPTSPIGSTATNPTTTATTSPVTTSPTTRPTTRPTGVSAERLAQLGRVLLTDADGNRYFDGVESLVRVGRDGREDRWPLPTDARGDAVTEPPPTLLLAGDQRLFLFNRTGRVLRLKPTPDGAEPFVLEATFTQNIPEERPVRIWLDPAGRIILAGEKQLAILFPEGFIPTAVRRMMNLDDDE